MTAAGGLLACSAPLQPARAGSEPEFASVAKLEEARYDERKLKRLIDICDRGFCASDLYAAIQARLAAVVKEREQFSNAQTEADYRAYLAQCVACAYREPAEKLLRNSTLSTAVPAPSAPPSRQPSSVASPPTDTAGSPSSETWNAVAHVIYRVRGSVRVAIGYSGPQPSAIEAQRAAKRSCEQNSDTRECDVSQASNQGCYFIIIGRKRGNVTWVSGASSDQVYEKCSNQGYSCRSPIGGCVD
ncbi:hypothetical protein XH88_14395 [Bradyrhizobium sp. CCBAU 51627]|nr:hypothetical protein [Bradyrhizobium sp. CCBAU 51627]